MIKVAGFQKNSFIDYPGKIASVVFLGGCNFACHYCHNSDILSSEANKIDFTKVLEELKEQIGFIDGVVITGGEPTLHPHLKKIIREIKNLGFLVKLDTNGTNSEILRELVGENLVDYIAMDIKAPLERYPQITGLPSKIEGWRAGRDGVSDQLQNSIDFLKQNTVDYMFRTTLSPLLTEDDIKKIGKLIDGAKCFQLQQFVPNEFSNSHHTVHLPHTLETAKKFEVLLSKHCEKVVLRGF